MSDQFDLSELVSATVAALNKAQFDQAAEFLNQVRDLAFNQGAKTNSDGNRPDALQTISFLANVGLDNSGLMRQQVIDVPLLQMIPLSTVGIDSANLTFECEVSPTSQASAASVARSSEATTANRMRTLSLPSRLARSTGGEKAAQNGNLKIEIALKRMDLPPGYLDMLANTQASSMPFPPTASVLGDNAVAHKQFVILSLVEISSEKTFEGFVARLTVLAKQTGEDEISEAITFSTRSEEPEFFSVLDPVATSKMVLDAKFEVKVAVLGSDKLDRSRLLKAIRFKLNTITKNGMRLTDDCGLDA